MSSVDTLARLQEAGKALHRKLCRKFAPVRRLAVVHSVQKAAPKPLLFEANAIGVGIKYRKPSRRRNEDITYSNPPRAANIALSDST